MVFNIRSSKTASGPKCVGVFPQMPIGVFDDRLRFPNPTRPAQRRLPVPGEGLLEFLQHRLPTGKVRVCAPEGLKAPI
jgi:hypothetical protein